MFKGTRAHPAGEFSAKVDEIGGSENAFTTADYTVFHETVAKEHLRLMMEYEADRMANLVLTNQTLLPERQVILEERRSRTDNDPGAQLGEAVSAALFRNSHYGIPVIGWAHEMAGLTLDDAMAWYNRYYTPNNAIVIIAGDVDLKDVRTFAAETYGNVARRAELSQRLRPTEPPSLTARSVSLSDERVRQPSMMRTYLARPTRPQTKALPRRSTCSRRYSAARPPAVCIGSSSSKTRSPRPPAPATRGSPSTIPVSASTPRRVAPSRSRRLPARSMRWLRILSTRGSPTTRWPAPSGVSLPAAIYAQDDQMTLAKFFGTALATGRSLADVEDWLNRIDAVTADQVVAAAKSYLDVRRSVTGYLVGAASETADMAAAPAAMKANVVR